MTDAGDELRPRLLRVRDHLVGAAARHPSRPGDRRAAVLLAITNTDEPALVGIVRTDVGPHGGQFALPGGAVEPGDPGSFATAVREMEEEVGLAQVPVALGSLGEYNTWVSRFRVDAHVAALPRSQRWIPQDREVAGVLEIPLARLADAHRALPRVEDAWDLPIELGYELDPSPFLVAGCLPERGRGHRLQTPTGVRSMPFIWGLTARVLYDFLRVAWHPSDEGA